MVAYEGRKFPDMMGYETEKCGNGEISKMQFRGNEGTQRPEIMEYETEQREKTDENR